MNQDVIDYLIRLQVRNYSSSRINQVRHAMELLIGYLTQKHQISAWREVRQDQIYQFTGWLGTSYRSAQGKYISLSTVVQWLSCVRVFLHWMVRERRLIQNPVAHMQLPHPRPARVRALSEQEISRLIEMPDISTKLGVRDRSLMELLYATGIRLGEVCRLDLYDVELSVERLTVREGKGGKDRVLPLTEQACHWLQYYVREVRPELALGRVPTRRKRQALYIAPRTLSSALWLTAEGRRLSWQTLLQMIRNYAKEINLRASVHTFRHCFAAHLLKRGANIEQIQRLLGHKNLDITQIYTHVETDDLKTIIKRVALPNDQE